MAVKYLRLKDGKALVTCLSSDTKPTATSGYLLIEEDTGDVFYVSASVWVKNVTGGGGSAWGSITGTLSSQSDLQAALDAKQATLVSATNIKTINGSTVLGSGDLVVSGATAITEVEIDFGSVPIKNKKFTITDATIAPTHKLTVSKSYADPSDGEVDSAEWFEDLTLMAKAGTGEFFLYASSPYNDTNGKLKITYIKG